jgi:hypothetical protein
MLGRRIQKIDSKRLSEFITMPSMLRKNWNYTMFVLQVAAFDDKDTE